MLHGCDGCDVGYDRWVVVWLYLEAVELRIGEDRRGEERRGEVSVGCKDDLGACVVNLFRQMAEDCVGCGREVLVGLEVVVGLF